MSELSFDVIMLPCAPGSVLHQETFYQNYIAFKCVGNEPPNNRLFRRLDPGPWSKSEWSFHSLLFSAYFPAWASAGLPSHSHALRTQGKKLMCVRAMSDGTMLILKDSALKTHSGFSSVSTKPPVTHNFTHLPCQSGQTNNLSLNN